MPNVNPVFFAFLHTITLHPIMDVYNFAIWFLTYFSITLRLAFQKCWLISFLVLVLIIIFAIKNKLDSSHLFNVFYLAHTF